MCFQSIFSHFASLNFKCLRSDPVPHAYFIFVIFENWRKCSLKQKDASCCTGTDEYRCSQRGNRHRYWAFLSIFESVLDLATKASWSTNFALCVTLRQHAFAFCVLCSSISRIGRFWCQLCHRLSRKNDRCYGHFSEGSSTPAASTSRSIDWQIRVSVVSSPLREKWRMLWDVNARSKPIASYDDAGCLGYGEFLPIRLILDYTWVSLL